MTLSDDFTASPGSKASALICWTVIAAFVGFMIWLQAHHARHNADLAASSETAPNFPLTISGPVTLAQTQLMNMDQSPQGQQRSDRLRLQLEDNIQKLAASPVDKLKAVVMTRELLGPDRAVRELDSQRDQLGAHPDLSRLPVL